MKYSSDGFAQIASSFRSPFYIYAEVIGSEGRLTLNRPFVMMDQDAHLTFYHNHGDAFDIPVPEMELYSGEVDDLQNAILDCTAPYLSLTETRNHILTILALYQSANEGDRSNSAEKPSRCAGDTTCTSGW